MNTMDETTGIKQVQRLFSSYNRLKQELEMQKLGLKYALCENRDMEIESRSLWHALGLSECGLSSVRPHSRKPESVALSLDESLQDEISAYRRRIALLENVLAQLDIFVKALTPEEKAVFTAKYLSKAAEGTLYKSERTVQRNCAQLAKQFLAVSSLTSRQLEMVMTRTDGFAAAG